MPTLLAIESSCDETAAAVIRDGEVLSNCIASQLAHERYGGVIPELASRLHQQEIVRVVAAALAAAGVQKQDLAAIACTQGPGLMGALMVGFSFAKAFALGLNVPLIGVNHLEAHVLANFLSPNPPAFPFLCLTVSGGHTQLVLVHSVTDMQIIGQTKDDAAGEAFDKGAKIMGLPYPGGPLIDKHAREGNPHFYDFPGTEVGDLDFSFSGIKTALLYYLQKQQAQNPDFIQMNLPDICASYQHRIIDMLLRKTQKAALQTGVRHLALAGGVSANSALRLRFKALCQKYRWTAHIPDFQYCTDNAGMIAIAAHYKFLAGKFTDLGAVPFPRGH